MLSCVRDWIKAYRICKKYGLTWDPFYSRKLSSYNRNTQVIHINPFLRYFYSVFLHEVGHHIHHKKVNLNVFFEDKRATDLRYSVNKKPARCVFKQLIVEYEASRFAAKCGADKKILRERLNTYIRPVFANREYMQTQVPEYFEAYLDMVAQKSRIFYKQ